MTRFCLLGTLVAVAVAAGGCLGGDDSDKAGGEGRSDPVVLTLANPGQREDLDEFVGEVASQSNGSLRIQVENAWRDGEIDFEQGTIADVGDGKVDLGSVGARALDLVGVKTLEPLVAPFAVDSYALEREVLASPVAGRMLTGMEHPELVGVTLLPGELRKPLGVSRALVEASDYRGATIGIRPSELSARSLRALGAGTEGYPVGGDISSLGGVEIHVSGIESGRYDGPAETLAVNVNLWPRPVAIVMNRGVYEDLTDDQRESLQAAGSAALDPAMEDIAGREKEAMGILCNRDQLDVRLASRSQLDTLRTATSPVTRALNRDPATRDAAREIAAMRAEVVPEPAPACTAEESSPITSSTTPIDGLWRMETTEDEYAQIAPAGDVVPENWGEFTLAFGAGRFAFTTEGRGACVWAYGTYTVDGEVTEWTIENGGGESPNDALNRPGELYRYGWSRYRDQLTLEPVKGAISPEPFRVKPWRLLDEEPSLDALSSRCPPPADALGA